MVYESLKKASLYFLKAAFIVAGFLSVLMFALIVRLHQGPLSLEKLKPVLQKQVEKLAPDFVVMLKHPEISWAGLGSPFKVHLQDVNINRRDDATAKASVSSLSLTYSLMSLMRGGLNPEGIEIEAPHLVFEGETFLAFLTAPQKRTEGEPSLSLLHNLLRSNLSFLKISQAQIALHDPAGWGVWTLPPADIVLNKSAGNFEINTSIIWQQQKYTLLLSYSSKFQEARFSLSIPRLTTAFFNDIQNSHFENASDQIKNLVNILRRNPLDFSLRFEGHYHFEKGIKSTDLQLSLFDGILDIPEFLPKSLKVQEGGLKATVKDNFLTIESCQLKSEQKTLKIRGTGEWNPKTYQLAFDLSTEALQVSAESLKDIWPKNLAPLPRHWVVSNISQAVFPRATCLLKGEVDLAKEGVGFNLREIQGKIEFLKGVFSYMDKLSKIESAKGVATYDRKDFQIHLTEGQSAGLRLKKGKIIIHGLDQEDQNIEMTLDILSSIPEALMFIDQPPLKFAQKYNMDTLKCSGTAETSLMLDFPLSTQLTLPQIKAQAASRLSNVSIIKPVSALDISVSRGDFDLKVNTGQILLQGHGLLNNAPAAIKWERALSGKLPYAMKLDINASLTPLWLEKAGLDRVSFFTGGLPTQVYYVENREKKGILEITSDLTPVEIVILGWHKRLGNKGEISLVLDFQNDKPQGLKKFSVTSVDGLKIEASGAFDPTGKTFTLLRLHHFEAGQNQFGGVLMRGKEGKYEVSLNGQSLNIEPLMKEVSNKEFSLPKEGLSVKANINQIYLDPKESLFNNTMNFYSQNNRFISFEYVSYLRPSQKKEDLIHILISSLSHNTRKLTLQTPAAGKLVKALGLPLKVHGGHLQMYATRNDALNQGPWEGKLRIQDFSVKDVPALGQILSLAFPTGMVDLFSDKGLSFQQFRTRFVLTPQKLFLSKGHAQGASLGITLQGSMDRSLKNLNLSGSVIPAYILNSLLSNIPLVGELITGGKHEGIFSVSYAVQGSRSNPVVSVNPISIFTPGFLRKIFDFGSEEAEEKDDEDTFEFDGKKP